MDTAPHRLVGPGQFEPEAHFYPRVLNAQMHALVRFFLSLSNERLVYRYAHLHPKVNADALRDILAAQPRHLRWSGCDLMHVTTRTGARQMVVIETNSCPSGQKSMPLYEEHDEQGGYRMLMERTVAPLARARRSNQGGLAVVYDKNEMECSGYAAAMADAFGESVHLVRFDDHVADPAVRFEDGQMLVRDESGTWHPIRCAFRYVTQKPWNRIPVLTKTTLVNPVLACLAGGRNKSMAAKAYDFYNADLAPAGLHIRTPETLWDVAWEEIPLWVKRWGGHAVIKVPYSNAGQGVYTITCQAELDAFLAIEPDYDRFILQSLIGNYHWSSGSASTRLFHVGTVPNKQKQSYVADLRMMVSSGAEGFRPLAIYARRARSPLVETLSPETSSWDILGTNLSQRHSDGGWGTDAGRLLLMDRKDFNLLGIGLDDLIEAYVQTVLATVAIDQMASNLTSSKGRLRRKLFRSLNDDPRLLGEVMS
ncbi:hypothetical protein [Haliangium ochraceum]|uniref:Uncharacterized protein n=1 Tax=Haliangium ochraceum (strain DSM 14365 / JCM 11303 / SMP-2) TaxID=502025 RepID=D0LZB8_HALO1|nr:hypothetical protein [Haliangium ochraceum]ACY16380.1 conserved hypothetical protein [Haliangium ochraceum DSM 14365]